ncbi:hypothetical protein Q1W71_21690 [Flavobacterium pectinovorum]|uniref:hypothetical protein n=1 Tax=Flavobacterium pectinovorum TaxID=29533 RepID=UPI00265E0DB5|nr:hypothetical protein [Flavobacterium pectinovorum]WKL47559.1 hypothetical protein Q1W71_21690 [Flavobacterium pectinovorum]
MKKTLIIIGGVFGFLYSLIGPIVSYSDTAPLDDEIGFEIASWKVFILESLLCISLGLLVGWIMFLFIKKVIKKKI